jgi:hypothetical protein
MFFYFFLHYETGSGTHIKKEQQRIPEQTNKMNRCHFTTKLSLS